ncbi:MAG TPA: hypothetical protein VFK22_06845 [Candidatus Dormibacteraeota bacterium]|nr:hypothetical protein [Candidatus Dormibacteraeota bacterium]
MKATLRALRDGRWTTVAFAVAGFAITYLQSLAFFQLAGHTFADRAAFGYSLLLEATANAALLPPPVHPETIAGYLELRAFEPLAILFASWALVSARARSLVPIVPRAAAFAVSTILTAAAACVGVLAGAASGGESVSGLGLVGAGLLLVALALACYAISLCAGRWAAPVLLTLFFFNSLSRIFPELDVARWLSPFRYYELSTPLPRGGDFDIAGFAVLLAIAAAGIAVAHVVATRRVAGPIVLPRATHEPSRVSLLAIPIARELYPRRIALAAWCVAFLVLGIVLVAATRATMKDLLALPPGLPGLPQYIFTFVAQVLGQTWFDVTLLLLVALTFAFVTRWADDDVSGRVEAVLSTPYSRSTLVVERLAAIAVTAAVLAAVGCLAVAATSEASSLAIDSTRLVAACLVLTAFGVVFAAVGVLFASWAPRAAPALFGAVALAAYLDDQIGGALRLPGWAQNISPFRLVGTPLASGVDGRSLGVLVAIAVAAIGSSILLIQRRDVGR